MNYVTRTLESVMEFLEGLSNDELVAIHNEYCQSTGNSDDEIYNNNEDFFETFFSGKVVEAVRAATYGDFQFSHDYVQFNGCANLDSFDDPSVAIDLGDIASDILDNERTMYYSSGFHLVNRLGFLVTEKEYETGMEEVKIDMEFDHELDQED